MWKDKSLHCKLQQYFSRLTRHISQKMWMDLIVAREGRSGLQLFGIDQNKSSPYQNKNAPYLLHSVQSGYISIGKFWTSILMDLIEARDSGRVGRSGVQLLRFDQRKKCPTSGHQWPEIYFMAISTSQFAIKVNFNFQVLVGKASKKTSYF